MAGILSPIPLISEIELTGLPAVKKSDIRAAKKKAYHHVGTTWLRKFMPGHFRAGARTKYGYRPRSAKYNKRKRIVKHHTQPLVYSGRLRDQVKRPANQNVVATSKGVTVKLRHHIVHRQVRQDLIAVTPEEQRILAEVFVSKVHSLLKKSKRKRTVKLSR